ncbi:hypothetical protein OF83DRAFT_1179168 [Amylostereum chailletii]|nr:hypothetical protein OF83DRAFT_1179168 [Amylostereum chailletii]
MFENPGLEYGVDPMSYGPSTPYEHTDPHTPPPFTPPTPASTPFFGSSLSGSLPPSRAGASPLDPIQEQKARLWAGGIANYLKLKPTQLSDLHQIINLGKDCLALRDLQIWLYSLGQMFDMKNSIAASAVDNKKVNDLLDTVLAKLEDKYTLSRTQTNHLIRKAKELAVEPARTTWSQLGGELAVSVRYDDTFADIFAGEPTSARRKNREAVLARDSGDKAKNARGQLRDALFESIVGPTWTSLDVATYTIIERFCFAGGGIGTADIPIADQIRIALLRRFVCEEQWEQWVEVEETPADSSNQPVTKKCKAPSGKVPRGKDFWSLVEAWYARKITENGTDLSSSEWQDSATASGAAVTAVLPASASPTGPSTSTAPPTSVANEVQLQDTPAPAAGTLFAAMMDV